MLLLNGAAATKNLSPHLFNPNAAFTFSNTSLFAILKDNESLSPPIKSKMDWQSIIRLFLEADSKSLDMSVGSYVDPTLFGIMGGLALMFIAMCVVLQIFAK